MTAPGLIQKSVGTILCWGKSDMNEYSIEVHELCRWLFSDTNRLGIDWIVMLGRMCKGWRTRSMIDVWTLQRSHLFVGMGSTPHTTMITPIDMCPDIANTVYIVIAFESYEMYKLLGRVSRSCTTCDTCRITLFTRRVWRYQRDNKNP